MSSDFEYDFADLERILGSLPDLVVVLDRDARIRYMNRAEPGYKAQDFIGRTAYEVMPDESQGISQEALQTVLATGEPQQFDAKVELSDGFEAWYRTRASPTVGSDGEARVLVVMQNVTAEKEREAEARQLRKLLPLCAWCDRLWDDDEGWSTMQEYVAKREGATVSHGICPSCSEDQLPGQDGNGETNGSVA